MNQGKTNTVFRVFQQSPGLKLQEKSTEEHRRAQKSTEEIKAG